MKRVPGKTFVWLKGFKRPRLRVAIEQWAGFVQQCEDGYSGDYCEYENEIGIRRWIQTHLNIARFWRRKIDPVLLDELAEIDNRFRDLLVPDVSIAGARAPWWEQSVPKMGRGLFVESVKELYGVDIVDLDSHDDGSA